MKIIRPILAAVLVAAVITAAILMEPAFRLKGFSVLESRKIERGANLIVYDASGCVIDSDEEGVSYAEIPEYVIDAFVAVEDARFFEHEGVDYYRMAGAALKNLKTGKYSEGASTITQQLVKNTHLSGEKSLKRKISEIRIARDVERRYGKREIMEMYLNALYFGNNVYGIKKASRFYFDKEPRELTPGEGATLAGLINNPAKYNPLIHPQNAAARRNLVLKRMIKNDKSAASAYSAQASSAVEIRQGCLFGEVSDVVISEAARILDCDRSFVKKSGLEIYTSLDSAFNSRLENLIAGLAVKDKNKLAINCVVADRKGRVIANAGTSGIDFGGNYRQPGSTIKPFVSYAPALEKKIILPATPILDEPASFGEYSPKNYRGIYLGWTDVKTALANSQNIPAVKLLEMSGVPYGKRVAEKFGLSFTGEDKNLGVALGGLRKGVTLTQLAGAYAALSDGGIARRAGVIDRIISNGKTIYRRAFTGKRVVGADTAYFLNEMLSECARTGTAKRLANCGFTVAAKTGTVGTPAGNTDAYCAAYTPQYTAVVWIGPRGGLMSNEITGGGAPAVLAKNALRSLEPDPEIRFEIPDSIEFVDIDREEYVANHRVMIAAGGKKKDTLSISVSTRYLPLAKKYYVDDYVLSMDKTVF